jgi:CBS domain containing-hemolysin-like protein
MSEFIDAVIALWPAIAAMVGLVAASGFFSASETALFYLSHDELRAMRGGNTRERAVAALLSDPDRLLTGVLFWNLVINLTYFSVSVVVAHDLHMAGQSAVAAGVFSLLSLMLIILFGEVLPKSLAVVLRRTLATLVVWPLSTAVRTIDPLTPTLNQLTRVARRTFWPHVTREPFLETDDLERAIDNSQLTAEVIRHERQVLHNILDLSEIVAEEVMRPRGTYPALPAPVRLADLGGKVPPSGYIAVQARDSEEIESVIPLGRFTAVSDDPLDAAAESIVHVPWCANLADTLQLLRNRLLSVASVVNEYGETVGIVTYEDIVDTILAHQPSRARRLLSREPVQEVQPGRFRADGITTLRHLCRRLELQFTSTSDGLVTVAGLLHEQLEHLPQVGDRCIWRGFEFEVTETKQRGEVRVMVSRVG